MAVKKYNLKIVYDINTGEVTHLSESFSDLDKVNFEVDGRIIAVPEEMQVMINEIAEDILGIS